MPLATASVTVSFPSVIAALTFGGSAGRSLASACTDLGSILLSLLVIGLSRCVGGLDHSHLLLCALNRGGGYKIPFSALKWCKRDNHVNLPPLWLTFPVAVGGLPRKGAWGNLVVNG